MHGKKLQTFAQEFIIYDDTCYISQVIIVQVEFCQAIIINQECNLLDLKQKKGKQISVNLIFTFEKY